MPHELDERAVATARALALDVVQAHGHGHAGAPMGLAGVAHVLFQSLLRHDPADPGWEGRDRFVLSAGHASLLLYIQLYLTGYPLTLEDLARTREMGSSTPGHPEHLVTPGVEMTTGPLGQGLASAVGMAMSLRHLAALAGTREAPFDQRVWCLASDGDLQEGVASEASSLAGTNALDNLVVIWDDNRVTIDGPTSLSFREDVRARYLSYGWHVESVDGNDLSSILTGLRAARSETGRPTLVAVRSVIGWPAPGVAGTAAAHSGGYGAEVVQETKKLLGLDPTKTMQVDEAVLGHTRAALPRGAALHTAWDEAMATWEKEFPDEAESLRRLREGPGLSDRLAVPATDGPVSTRKASAAVLRQLAESGFPVWGGSADLSESTSTRYEDAPPFSAEDPAGNRIHFGIREHAMAAILNGIALHGWFRPYGSTYLTFSDYLRPALRLAALMRLPVIHVLTHDSLAVGEDGPTHQPVEQLWSLRMVPGVDVVRPADAGETAAVWRRIATEPLGPTCLVLSRQDLPGLTVDTADAARGGYVVRPAEQPDLLMLATGSEVHLALEAADVLASRNISVQVVSMPCLEWFELQPAAYRDTVLPPHVRARVSVEAAVEGAWCRWLGDDGVSVAVHDFGVSGGGAEVMELRGISVRHAVDAALETLHRVRAG